MVCVSVLRVPIRFGSTWLMLAEFVSDNKFVSGSGSRRTIFWVSCYLFYYQIIQSVATLLLRVEFFWCAVVYRWTINKGVLKRIEYDFRNYCNIYNWLCLYSLRA